MVAVCGAAHSLPVSSLHGKEIDQRLLTKPKFRARLILIFQRFPGLRSMFTYTLTVRLP